MLDKHDLDIEDKMGPGPSRAHPARRDRRGYCGECRVVREVTPPRVGVLTCPECGAILERIDEAEGKGA